MVNMQGVIRPWRSVLIPLAAAVILAGCAAANYAWQSYVRSPLPDTALLTRDAVDQADCLDEAAPTEILMNVLGIYEPEYATLHDRRITDAMRVIGIVINGRALAFSVRALSMPAGLPFSASQTRRHVVNQLIGDTAVSVTYCDTSHCARVLSRSHQSRWLELGVGGICNGQMLLCFEGQQYYHNSREIPLSDVDYEVTSWSKWKARHPASQIYLGE